MFSAHAALKKTLDLLFPITCLGCTCGGRWLCPACWRELSRPAPLRCLGCDREEPVGRVCAACHRRVPWLSGVWSVGGYEQPLLREAIAALKFECLPGLAQPLAGLLWAVLRRPTPSEYLSRVRGRTVIAPVPMDRARRRSRGIDHAARLARALGLLANLPVVEALEKQPRASQVGLTDAERRVNLRGAFSVRQPLEVFGKTVILVDDVLTTGTTAAECAKILRATGARAVWALVLAKG